MSRVPPTNDDEALLKARGTHPEDRGTEERPDPERLYAQLLPPWVGPMVSGIGARPLIAPRIAPMPRFPAPRFTNLQRFGIEPPRASGAQRLGQVLRPVEQLKPLTEPRPRRRKDDDNDVYYSAAFRQDFFPPTQQGYDLGERKARELCNLARYVMKRPDTFQTAVLLVEHQRVDGSTVVIAGINGSFSAEQHAALDRLGIIERYNLRDKTGLYHPDVRIAFGQVGATDGDAAALGSSIPFCSVCEHDIAAAGFVLIPDGPDVIYTSAPSVRTGVRSG